MTGDLLPEFAFQHSAHDRLSDMRGDADFRRDAWDDPSTRVVVMHGMSLEVNSDGTALATRSPRDASEGPRTLLGASGGIVYFLVAEPDPAPSDPAQSGPATTSADKRPGPVGSGGDAAPYLRTLREVATTLAPADASLAVHAVALTQWHSRHGRCAVCGAQTVPAVSGESRHCPDCGASHFPRTDPAVIMLVVDDEDRCLLGHNAARDATWYSTLAGFVEPGETLEDAVAREVAEETGVIVDRVTYAGSQPWPFPSSLMLGFLAHASGTTIAVDGVEITKAGWYSRDELRRQIESGDLVVPSSISISGALLESWYGGPLPSRSVS